MLLAAAATGCVALCIPDAAWEIPALAALIVSAAVFIPDAAWFIPSAALVIPLLAFSIPVFAVFRPAASCLILSAVVLPDNVFNCEASCPSPLSSCCVPLVRELFPSETAAFNCEIPVETWSRFSSADNCFAPAASCSAPATYCVTPSASVFAPLTYWVVPLFNVSRPVSRLCAPDARLLTPDVICAELAFSVATPSV